MASSGIQARNGKAFEYALATQYVKYLNQIGIRTEIVEDSAYKTTKKCFEEQPEEAQERFNIAAYKTTDTIVILEPGLISPKNPDDILTVSLTPDAEGQKGEVRDVIFSRAASRWEVGFSAKNNNESAKHSRLSDDNDFGEKWFGVKCSQQYWDEVLPITRHNSSVVIN